MVRVAGCFTRIELSGLRLADDLLFIDVNIAATGEELDGFVSDVVNGPAGYFFKAEQFCGEASMVAVKDGFRFSVYKNGVRKFSVPQDLRDDPGRTSKTDALMRPQFVGVHEIKLIVGHSSILRSGPRFTQSFRAYGIFEK